MVSKKSLILTIVFFLILTLAGSVVSYFVGLSAARGASLKQYILTEDVPAGHSLQGKYTEALVPSNISVEEKYLVMDESILDSHVATKDLRKNAPITVDDVVALEEQERNFEVAIPITIEGSVANTVKPGDLVAIKLTYDEGKQEDAVVIPQITVNEVRSSNGAPIVDDSTVAAFVIFRVTNEEQSLIKNALKEGSLYCAKYKDLNQEVLEQTYFVTEGQATEQNTDAATAGQ